MPAASEKTEYWPASASFAKLIERHRSEQERNGPGQERSRAAVECVQEVAGNLPNTTSVSSEIGQEQKTECAHPFFFA